MKYRTYEMKQQTNQNLFGLALRFCCRVINVPFAMCLDSS